MVSFKSSICAALLFLVIQGDAASQEIQASQMDEQQHQELRECKGFSCNRIRPVSENNPFGIDLGWGGSASNSGVPTRALAMVRAQVVFAGEKCPKPSKFTALGFRGWFLGPYGMLPKRDFLRLFFEQTEKFKENYDKAWLTLDDSQRDVFCKKYYDDATFKVKNFKVAPSEFYMHYLSPISDEGIQEFEVKMKRAEKVKWLAIFGQLLSTAAQVSAAHDSIQTGNSALREGGQGNIGAMNTQMSQSRALFADSTTFYNTGQHFASAASALSGDTMTGVKPQLGGDFSNNLKCQALIHFTQWDAPPDAEIWKTYQSLATDCEALNQLRIE